MTGLYSMKTYYWRIDELDSQKGVTAGDVWYFRPRHLAFADAEGYGRFARGGRGGVVVHVTNLNDSGAGSLRAAIENDVGPRTVVFDVSGIIALASRLTLTSNYVTVAGQTAPGKGICIRAAPFGTAGAQDDVIRDVRVRLGAGMTYDGMGLEGSNHCIVDHASISWTIDEGFSSRNGLNITLQRTMIAEALNDAGHQNYPAGTLHGYAGSISGDTGSFHHNLLAHNEGRNWSLAGGLAANGNYAGLLDIFNNVVYNWGGRATDGGAHEVDFVANYYKPGAATSIFVALNAQYDSFPGTQQYYFAGNVMPGYFDASTQSKGREVTVPPNGYSPWVTTPFFPSYATVQTAAEGYKNVLSDVGCTQPVFDDHDTRIVKETLNGTHHLQREPDRAPRAARQRERRRRLRELSERVTRRDLGQRSATVCPTGGRPTSGSTRSPLRETSPTATPTPISTASRSSTTICSGWPSRITSPPSGPTSRSTWRRPSRATRPARSTPRLNVVNATVTISGQTATFKPSHCGMASWQLTVTDSAGGTMTKNVGAFVQAGASNACP